MTAEHEKAVVWCFYESKRCVYRGYLIPCYIVTLLHTNDINGSPYLFEKAPCNKLETVLLHLLHQLLTALSARAYPNSQRTPHQVCPNCRSLWRDFFLAF